MILYKRNQYEKIGQLLELFPAVVIIGARQTGKTTLAKQLRPNWRYLDLENPNDFDQLSHDPLLYFLQYPDDIIIDEAQSYPKLFEILRGIIDRHRQQKGRFILTGSSSPELTKLISESLAGRVAVVEISTLKINEYYQKPLSPFYELFNDKLSKESIITGKAPYSINETKTVWLKGGYPEPIIANNEIFYEQWMENYYTNYIYRDISKLFPKLNKIKYQRFIKMLGKLSGTIINRSDLARALEISEGSVREYLKIADGTFIWRELPSFENSIIKSIVKMPKGYIRDSGLLHHLLNIRTQDDLFNHPSVGYSFESFVIDEILKGINATNVTNWNAHYFRTRKGVEVDLILQGYFGTLPIEIKYSSNVKMKNLNSLNDFIEKHNLPFGIVINLSEEVTWLSEKIVQIPVGWL